MTRSSIFACLTVLATALCASQSAADLVRLQDLGKFQGARDNELIGYGIVVGLASTGDSAANRATIQSIANTLIEFGVNVDIRDIRSRNAAAVMVTAVLPPFIEEGQRIDVKVSSLGDARSLAGGTLFLTPIYGPDENLYALAQGQLTVGGYAFDSFDSTYQKNHPTVGTITNGAIVERSIETSLVDENGELNFVLDAPNIVTAQKIVEAAVSLGPSARAEAVHAGKVRFSVADSGNAVQFATMARIQQLRITPDTIARIVINERTGTIVAGGDVRISDVTISHENIRLSIDTKYWVSQPNNLWLSGIDNDNRGISTVVVPDTEITVNEQGASAVTLGSGTTVAELLNALIEVDAGTRDIIAILQAIKRAGALQAEIVVE